MNGPNDVEQLRVFILQVIAERTMPNEYAAPDDDWLVPYSRLVDDRRAIDSIDNAMRLEIAMLKRRIERLEAVEPR